MIQKAKTKREKALVLAARCALADLENYRDTIGVDERWPDDYPAQVSIRELEAALALWGGVK
jgi:hypothetical protein